MADPEHFIVYNHADTLFTFAADPEQRVWDTNDLLDFAAVRIGKRDRPPSGSTVDYCDIAELVAGAIGSGQLVAAVSAN